MKKVALVLGALAMLSVGIVFAQELSWKDIGGGNSNFSAVWVNPANNQLILAGRWGEVLRSQDGGANWRSILFIRGQNRQVNFLLADSKSIIYAATDNGLFKSADLGKRWQRIFRGKNSAQSQCIVLAVIGDEIYLGTKNGLFIGKHNGRFWSKAKERLANASILAIAVDEKSGLFYAACSEGVYKIKAVDGATERIFFGRPVETSDDDNDDAPELQEDEERPSEINYLAIDSNNPANLYLASSRGLYQSSDAGLNWKGVTDFGLLEKNLKFIFVSFDSQLYGLTKRGVFIYEGIRWRELSLSLLADEVRFLAKDKQGNLYIASDKGLFKSVAVNYTAGQKNNLLLSSESNEPGIRQVQQQAIKYAEVNPEKIVQWRKQAAKKAFFPKVSAGVNNDTSDLWHWETGSSTKIGDDELVRGKEIMGWDVTVSWDLSEIIWNNDQTSIDTRSRLMVQLREDVLDEVTKLYFERQRTKMELVDLPIEERKKRQEKELHLAEITAMLDGLTGGYFAQALN